MEQPTQRQPQGERPDRGAIAMVVCSVLLMLLTAGLIVTLLRVRINDQKPYAAVNEAAGIIEDKFYFLEDDSTALTQNAIRGMLSGLDDPYAAYYTEEEYNAMLEEDAGDYQGIGISVLAPNETGGYIMTVYPASPMAEAGALAGDIILNVNGTDAADLTMDDFLALFSSEDGGTDTLVLLRGEERFTVKVTRRAVHATRIYSELLKSNVGYLRLEQFTGTIVNEFWEDAASLRAQGAESLIIDLRDNPGGGLNEVLGICNYLLPKGSVICTIKSRHSTEKVYRAEGDERLEGIPIAVLVNGNSASASELLSGALQDHGIAVVVGTQTFGKGIVQSYYRLKNGAGWIKLTTDAYYTPNDVCIHETGITPDHCIEQAKAWEGKTVAVIPHDEDVQLVAALEILAETMPAAA